MKRISLIILSSVGIVVIFSITEICSSPVPGREYGTYNYNPSTSTNRAPITNLINRDKRQHWYAMYNNGYNQGSRYPKSNYNSNPQYTQEVPQYLYQHQNNPNQQQSFHHPYEDEPEPPFTLPMPMMEPIRRMYHVYEDNAKYYAKRFRSMMYTPMRMMG